MIFFERWCFGIENYIGTQKDTFTNNLILKVWFYLHYSTVCVIFIVFYPLK